MKLENLSKKVMKNPNPEAATAFVEMLDRDRDGIISVKELLEYIEERKHIEEENMSSGTPSSPPTKTTEAKK